MEWALQVQSPANRIRKYPTGRNFGLDCVSEISKRFDDRHYSGVFIILVSLGLIFEMSPPN
jgi:hypothetical protein